MAEHNIIVIGASAGGYEPLKTIAAGLPKDLDASVFVVWHMSPDVRGILPQVMNRNSGFYAAHAVDQEPIERGRIYVAPPDRHLLIEEDHVRVTRGPKENRFRPAVDPLFRSAAYFYTTNVIGVILSGALDDGTSGLWTVKHRGGIAVVQSPVEAEVRSMPDNALREVEANYIVQAAEMPELFARLVREKNTRPRPVSGSNGKGKEDDLLRREINVAREDRALEEDIFAFGELTPFTCPDCHGVLARLKDGNLNRFRCHTGHAFSPDTLLSSVTELVEESLWDAVRGIDETIMMLNELGDHFADHNQPAVAAKYFQKAREASERADIIRTAIFTHEELSEESVREEAALDEIRAMIAKPAEATSEQHAS